VARRPHLTFLLSLLTFLGSTIAHGDDGYRLWLKYDKVKDPGMLLAYREAVSSLVMEGSTPTEAVTKAELIRALEGLLDRPLPLGQKIQDGALLVGTPATSPLIASLKLEKTLKALGPEGYVIRLGLVDLKRVVLIASDGPTGALYGAFHFLKLLQTQQPLETLDLSDHPRVQLRVLDHWDNLDGSIERGYAGASLWDWKDLPSMGPKLKTRLTDYARANASLGINGCVLNNVNASADILTEEYLAKVAAIAEIFRPYGLKVYLSANFAAPKRIGGLLTSDPLDKGVLSWWKKKADGIYALIPDFGGFLVKANSEGQSGPQDYGRSHRQGANMLAQALRPHGGIVMWRAFVYNADLDPDRINRAYKEFKPEDGKFEANVLVQSKNGALDFQPREPFAPLFGGLKRTPLMAELQVTQEYLGHSTHLAYLAPMWEEFFKSDTYAKGPGSTVAKVVDGRLFGQKLTGVAGVANTGTDRNWTGHPMAQANWHAFGRLAWNPEGSAEELAVEWVQMTLSNEPKVVATAAALMLESRQAFVDYTCPLGLAGVFERDLHYAPDPGMVDERREDWSAAYYVRADRSGLGFDRTRKGSKNVDQYAKPLSDTFNDPKTCPDKYLLWFHHMPWNETMKSGLPFWEELVLSYNRGVKRAEGMKKEWRSLEGQIDGEFYGAVLKRLEKQVKDAYDWRNKCLAYFQGFSRMPIPDGM